MSSSEDSGDFQGDLLADAAEEAAIIRQVAAKLAALREGDEVPPELIQEMMTAMVRLYTVRFQVGERFAPFLMTRDMPATSVMIMSTAMLRAVNLELFELGMFQAWSGV
ncbi:MAG: hypothetical protein AB7K86_12055 [Rhodospirillales bacterium]